MWFEKIFQVFFYLLFVDLSNQLMNFVRLLIYFCIRSLFLLQLSIATIWEICLDALFQRNLLKFIRTNKWRNSAIFTPISIKQLKKYFYKPTFFIYLSLYIYIFQIQIITKKSTVKKTNQLWKIKQIVLRAQLVNTY